MPDSRWNGWVTGTVPLVESYDPSFTKTLTLQIELHSPSNESCEILSVASFNSISR